MDIPKYYIYTLIDPSTDEIRYVGQTSRNLDRRYKDHCAVQYARNHRAHWLNQLRSLDLKPIMKIIEECDESNWQERERYWIKYYRELGCDLVNATDGGEGTKGWNPSEETRIKMGEWRKGKPLSENTKQKIRESKQLLLPPKAKRTRSEAMQGNQRFLGRVHTKETKQKMGISLRGVNAKLTEADVRHIKQLLLEGTQSKDIAHLYKVTPSTIYMIKAGKNWAWVK